MDKKDIDDDDDIDEGGYNKHKKQSKKNPSKSIKPIGKQQETFSQTCPTGTYVPGVGCVTQVVTQITTATCRSGLIGDFFWGSVPVNPCPGGWQVDYPIRTAAIINNQITWYFCIDELDVGGMTTENYFSSVYDCGGYQAYQTQSIIFSTTNRYLVYSYCSGYGEMIEASPIPTTTDATKNLCASVRGTISSVKSIEIFSAICPNGYTGTAPSCIDINECSIGSSGCSQGCENTNGGFYCYCSTGYKLNANGKTCDLIDPCANNNCQGSCVASGTLYECKCPSGYRLNVDGKSCDLIDPCENNNCQGSCVSSGTSYECKCPTGYRLNVDGKSCDLIDPCENNNCEDSCVATGSSYECKCPTGYRLNVDGKSCDFIDPCENNNCQGSCVSSGTSYECKCPTGYRLNVDGKSCDFIDPCENNNCEDSCVASGTSYECKCPTGYRLNVDEKSCDLIDPCENNSCEGSCIVTGSTHYCQCPSGYILASNGYGCVDIDECLSKESNLCDLNTVCENKNGSYLCKCNPPEYSYSSQFTCEPKPIITNFYQKPSISNVFIVKGFNFAEFNTKITVGEMICQYILGNDSFVECSSGEGKEVFGNVLVEANDLLSDPFNFIGAPFIVGYSHSPPTLGGDLITITGRNFPTLGSIQILVNSVKCSIIELTSKEQIICNIGEGSGSFNYIRLFNDSVTNTDTMYLTYANPIISSTSKVYLNGGILTIFGSNFGVSSKSLATLAIGNKHCKNVEIKSHSELTCELEPSLVAYTLLIDLVVDGLPVANDNYFTYSRLEDVGCPLDCSDNGDCTINGCVCKEGKTGISCNETAVEIEPIPPIVDIPSIDIGSNNSESGYGYKVSIIRIEELDFNDKVLVSIDLLQSKWGLRSSTNQWTFNITLENQSYLEATFEYFKQSRNITFSSNSFIIPSESLKLSFKTQNWPFIRKLDSLRIVVATETLLLNDDVKECSIDQPIVSRNSYHLYTTTKNPETGMFTRFVSYASIDGHPAIAHIESLDSPSRTTLIIGISVPYFRNESLIDPDFGMLLNVNNKPTGTCEHEKSVNWKLATGVSIGGAAAVAMAGVGAYVIRDRKKKKQFNSMLNK
ncbi:hypothetical protein RB653_000561 [Dictyostelium firmibasis]|uniref:EGF-like domain-containing protein n=1 Tax=Dictyostelium firmibasis TaxID=79012 RepID=A0AAN7U3I5_9MYCE